MAKRLRFITIIYVQYLFTNFAMYNTVLLVKLQSGLADPRSHWVLGRATLSRLTQGLTDR